MECRENEKLWVEKYRPSTINECILTPTLDRKFKSIVQDGYIPNMLLHGGPGCGKTTVARALCEELNLDYIIINASDERGLSVLRVKITDFASSVSLSGNGKCVILDESDYLLPDTQSAFRNSLEELSSNCSFIWTANYPHRIIEPLHSRLESVNFKIDKEDLEDIQAKTFARLCDILDNEGIKYDDAVVYNVMMRFHPDTRKVIKELQNYSRSGCIDEGILMAIKEVNIQDLISKIKDRKFKDVRKWAADNADDDLSMMYEHLYREMCPMLQPDSIGQAIRILEDYQRWDSQVASRELHLAALCVELMYGVEFK